MILSFTGNFSSFIFNKDERVADETKWTREQWQGLFNIQGTTTKMSPAWTQYHHDSPPSVDATSVILVSDFASELGLEVVNFLLDANLTRHLKENV